MCVNHLRSIAMRETKGWWRVHGLGSLQAAMAVAEELVWLASMDSQRRSD